MKISACTILVYFILTASALITLGCSHGKTKEIQRFVNPFFGIVPKNRPQELQPNKCRDVPAPVVDVMGQTYYSDERHSIIDPKKFEQSRELTVPLRSFNNQIARLSDRIWMFDDIRAESCLYTWLSTWARAGALLGDANYQGEFERKWNLSGIALAYLKVAPLLHWKSEQKSTIIAWLEKIAKRVRSDYDQKLDRQSRRNNHIYWAGLSVMATAIFTQNTELYNWGLTKAQQGIMDITNEGFLKEELDRARRARHYHSFALQALTMIAFLADKNGTDLYELNNSSLHRLAKKTLEGYQDASVFEKATSVEQEPMDLRDLDWTTAYLFKNPSSLSLAKLKENKSEFSPWLGGDLSVIFSMQK